MRDHLLLITILTLFLSACGGEKETTPVVWRQGDVSYARSMDIDSDDNITTYSLNSGEFEKVTIDSQGNISERLNTTLEEDGYVSLRRKGDQWFTARDIYNYLVLTKLNADYEEDWQTSLYVDLPDDQIVAAASLFWDLSFDEDGSIYLSYVNAAGELAVSRFFEGAEVSTNYVDVAGGAEVHRTYRHENHLYVLLKETRSGAHNVYVFDTELNLINDLNIEGANDFTGIDGGIVLATGDRAVAIDHLGGELWQVETPSWLLDSRGTSVLLRYGDDLTMINDQGVELWSLNFDNTLWSTKIFGDGRAIITYKIEECVENPLQRNCEINFQHDMISAEGIKLRTVIEDTFKTSAAWQWDILRPGQGGYYNPKTTLPGIEGVRFTTLTSDGKLVSVGTHSDLGAVISVY